jgi:hypothetical protein
MSTLYHIAFLNSTTNNEMTLAWNAFVSECAIYVRYYYRNEEEKIMRIGVGCGIYEINSENML